MYIVADVDDAMIKLNAKGIQTIKDIDLQHTHWGIKKSHLISQHNIKSIFLQDLDFNLIRLISYI